MAMFHLRILNAKQIFVSQCSSDFDRIRLKFSFFMSGLVTCPNIKLEQFQDQIRSLPVVYYSSLILYLKQILNDN